MRWVFLSPHFDDAALSCGGLIWDLAKRGNAVEIWTVCAGNPGEGRLSELASHLHERWATKGGRETVEVRRAEDKNAAAILGASTKHFSTLDCIYRADAAGRFLYLEDVFDPPHAADAELSERIAAELGRELDPEDQLVAPLAVGHHVDHVITRAAVERLQRPNCLYYADIPYLLKDGSELPRLSQRLFASHYAPSPAALRAWLKGIAAYGSQMGILFGSEKEMRRQIRAYCQGGGGVSIWSTTTLQFPTQPAKLEIRLKT